MRGVAFALLVGIVALATVAGAAPSPQATLGSQEALPANLNQGLARIPNGWIASGTTALARFDDHLALESKIDQAIPQTWVEQGFDHIGDVDVAGAILYVPFEQPDYTRNVQAMARYNARDLTFRDARIVHQHENSFVAVDARTGIAYSMDRFGGRSLLRYDVRAGWRRLAPLELSRRLERVQGASVARGAVWLMTDDAQNGMYRVNATSGAVTRVGDAPPAAGEGEGIDATRVGTASLHATVVAPDKTSVALQHFGVTGETDAPAPTTSDTSWPPVLVYFAVFIAVVAIGAVASVLRRAGRTVRGK